VVKLMEQYEGGRKMQVKTFDPQGHLEAGPPYPSN
jgi:hypothetical protein